MSLFYSKNTIQQQFLKLNFFLFFLLFSSIGFAQDVITPQSKLDPVFSYIIQHKNDIADSLVYKNMPSPYKAKPTKGFAAKGGPLEERYDCIVYTKNAQALKDSGIIIRSGYSTFVTAWVSLEQIEQMSQMADVNFIKAPETVGLYNDGTVGSTGASLLHQGKLNNTVYKGKGVLVAIFDTGIDWDHPDFRNATDQTKSRILRIWDQTITPIAGETSPAGFGYGVEYTQAQIENELDGSPIGFVREKDINGHGTHVAGTAAGNGAALTSKKYAGMAPEAEYIIVKGGNGSFSSTDIINALSYLQTLATSLNRPIVLNMSLGGQSGPHDGTQAQEAAVNSFTSSAAGRVVVISAGNDNGTNIHNQLNLASAAGGSVSFTVPSAAAGTDVFQYSIYSNSANAVSATVTTPLGATVVATGSTSVAVTGGTCAVNITNAIDPGNGQRYVNLYITRTSGNPSGTWTLNITNTGAATITMDGWLNYTNASYSTTALVGGNSAYLVGSPGNATSAITAAAYMAKYRWYSTSTSAPGGYSYGSGKNDSICTFSSHGPRRDGLQKPDIAANGQAMVSCLSSDAGVATTSTFITNQGLYQVEQGTSMSSPAIAGAVALLLQAKPSATAAEIKTLLTSTANTDVWTAVEGPAPNTTWGYGKLDVFKAASSIFSCTPATRETIQYDNNVGQASSTSNVGLSSAQRVGLRFQPTTTGKLGGVFIHTGTVVLNSTIEVRVDNAGVPGALYNVTSFININSANEGLARYSWNYIDLSSLNVNVAAGTNYFIVVYSSAGSWSLLSESQSVAGRSFVSGNSGTTWGASASDYLIRPVVYNNSQSSIGALATTAASDTRDINTSNQFLANSCQLMAQLQPDGTATSVAGTVECTIWLEPFVPHAAGQPFVSRHYQMMPSNNASTATGRITLYFTQAEFTAFNADPASTFDMPADAVDGINSKANIRIGKYPGISSDGTGLPGSYGGSAIIIDPVDTDIIWNAEYNRWEISFNTTGFSGFILQTATTPLLAIGMEYFTGKKQAAVNILNWKVNCSTATTQFEVQRSNSGANSDFTDIGTFPSLLQQCSQPFAYTDASPLNGKNYYRIKVTESTGRVYYTNTILLQMNEPLNTLYPTIIAKGGSVQVNYITGAKGSLLITDIAGRQVNSQPLANGVQNVNLPLYSGGIYLYSIKDDKGKTTETGKLVVQ